jgi:hypothetical protein
MVYNFGLGQRPGVYGYLATKEQAPISCYVKEGPFVELQNMLFLSVCRCAFVQAGLTTAGQMGRNLTDHQPEERAAIT